MDLIPLIDQTALERVRKPLEDAWTLPPESYINAEIFDAEVDNIFLKDWICVGHTSQIAQPGDYRAIEVCGRPIVITRDNSGEIHALSNVCVHRAMPVAQGCGNAKTLTCPYHLWSYNLDGTLRGAPLMEGVNDLKSSTPGLPKLPVGIYHGFVFVSLTAGAPSVAEHFGSLTQHLSAYPLEDLEVVHTSEWDGDWNWKLLVENFMEAYHHIGPHRDSAEPSYPAKGSRFFDNEGDPYAVIQVPAADHQESTLPPFPGLSEDLIGELVIVNAFPTFMFYTNGSLLAWYELIPRAQNQTHLKIHTMLHKDVAASLDANATEGIGNMLAHIHTEDLAVVEGPWASISSGAATQGRLSLLEQAIWQLNQIWSEKLTG